MPRAIIESSDDLPDPGPGEDPEALALAAGDERVERPYAERQLFLHEAAPQRVRRHPVDRQVVPAQARPAVDGPAEPVDDAAEEMVVHAAER